MQCYFLRNGHLAGVEMLPPGFSDEEAITRAHTLSSKRKGTFDSFEVSAWSSATPRSLRPVREGVLSPCR